MELLGTCMNDPFMTLCCHGFMQPWSGVCCISHFDVVS